MCKGAGHVKRYGGGPLDPPELVLCSCTRERYAERAWKGALAASRMGPDLWACSFAGFERERQPEAFRHARAFAAALDPWLALYGPTGTGKTHLLAAVANQLIQGGRRPLYWSFPDLVAHLQAGYRDGSHDERLEAVRAADVLLLDELGVEKETPDRFELLYKVVNHRLTWRLPTAIASNLLPARFPPRLRSRLGDPERVVAVAMRPYDYRTGEASSGE